MAAHWSLGDVWAEALMNALADTLTETETETLGKILGDAEAAVLKNLWRTV